VNRPLTAKLTVLQALLLCFGVAFCGTPASSMEVPAFLEISQTSMNEATSKAAKQNWNKFCAGLGTALTKGKGPWGGGVFGGFYCKQGGVVTSGKPQKTDWILSITEKDQTIDFAIRNRALSKTKNLSNITLVGHYGFIKALTKKNATQLLAIGLLDQLPFFGVISAGDYAKQFFAFDGTNYSGLSPYPKLIPYHLSFEKQIFRPRVLGNFLQEPLKCPEGKVCYKLASTVPATRSNKTIYVHNAEGPGRLRAQIEAQLNAAIETFADSDRGRSLFVPGYAALRYGVHILAPDTLGKKARLIGVIAETRGAALFFLPGLRFSLDVVPRVSESSGDDDFYLGWQRYSFGARFQWQPSFVSQVALDFAPKLGVMSLGAKLPVESTVGAGAAAAPTSQTFAFTNEFAWGLETGLTVGNSMFYGRGWYGYDVSPSFGVANKVEMVSHRFGIDGVKAFKAKGLSPVLLLFYLYESMTCQKTLNDGSNPTLILPSQYVGLGVGVGW
jgi:hypothetical protein